MLDLGQAMLDPVFLASHIEHMRHVSCLRVVRIARQKGEPDPIVGERRMDLVEDGCALPPLRDRLLVDPVASGEASQALLTILHCLTDRLRHRAAV